MAKSRYSELGFLELLMIATAFIAAGAVSIFTFNNFLRAVSSFSKPAVSKVGTASVLKSIQPYLEKAKPFVDAIFGANIPSPDLQHFLLAAILIVLIGVWRTVHIQNQIAAEQLDIARAGLSEAIKPEKANKKSN
jgi:uncharacterized membrane protein